MTLDEAIEYAESITAEKREEACKFYGIKNYEESRKNIWYYEEYKQLAAWLKELRAIINIVNTAEKIIEDEYGVVIVEGYYDVFDLIKTRVELLNKLEESSNSVLESLVDEMGEVDNLLRELNISYQEKEE